MRKSVCASWLCYLTLLFIIYFHYSSSFYYYFIITLFVKSWVNFDFSTILRYIVNYKHCSIAETNTLFLSVSDNVSAARLVRTNHIYVSNCKHSLWFLFTLCSFPTRARSHTRVSYAQKAWCSLLNVYTSHRSKKLYTQPLLSDCFTFSTSNRTEILSRRTHEIRILFLYCSNEER